MEDVEVVEDAEDVEDVEDAKDLGVEVEDIARQELFEEVDEDKTIQSFI